MPFERYIFLFYALQRILYYACVRFCYLENSRFRDRGKIGVGALQCAITCSVAYRDEHNSLFNICRPIKLTLYLHYGLLYTMSVDKTLLFEYVMYRLIEWYREGVEPRQRYINKHFSRLTALKLLFFVSTIKDPESNNRDLLDIFNNYCAMQYGPVEIDIYTAIVNDRTKLYKFGVHELVVTPQSDAIFDSLIDTYKNRIDRAISLLKGKNHKIIYYPASLLIDISHKWDAWQNAMSIATMLGRRCESMPIDSIRENRQFYE